MLVLDALYVNKVFWLISVLGVLCTNTKICKAHTVGPHHIGNNIAPDKQVHI